MIPKQEQFLDAEPITGTIDEILNLNIEVDVDSEDHCYQEIMHEYDVSKEEAVMMYKKAKLHLIQNMLDEMVRDGKVCVSGVNEDGDKLYTLVEKKKTKKTKKKK